MITVALILLQIFERIWVYKQILHWISFLECCRESASPFVCISKRSKRFWIFASAVNVKSSHSVFKLKSGCDYHELFSVWKHARIFTGLVEYLRSFFYFVNQCACESMCRRYELKRKRWSITICCNGELNRFKRQKVWISLKWFAIQLGSSAWGPYSG